MSLVKHYILQSDSLEKVTNLEMELKAYICNERESRLDLNQIDKEISRGTYGGKGSAFGLGDFDVLYRKEHKITHPWHKIKFGLKKQRPWLFPITPISTTEIELVLKGEPSDFRFATEYFDNCGFQVAGPKDKTDATFMFTTDPNSFYHISSYVHTITNFLTKQFEDIEQFIYLPDENLWVSDQVGSSSISRAYSGMLCGPIKDVLDVRKILLDFPHLVKLEEEKVTFLEKRNGENYSVPVEPEDPSSSFDQRLLKAKATHRREQGSVQTPLQTLEDMAGAEVEDEIPIEVVEVEPLEIGTAEVIDEEQG